MFGLGGEPFGQLGRGSRELERAVQVLRAAFVEPSARRTAGD